MKPAVLVTSSISLLALLACTGSKEGGISGLKLAIASNPTVTNNVGPRIPCGGTPNTANGPGVLLLPAVSTSELNGPDANCTFTATDGPVYDLVNTPDGERYIVSIPVVNGGKGRVEIRDADTSAVISSLDTGTADTVGFCPTQMALSADQTKLLVLDDPGDPALSSLPPTNTNPLCPNSTQQPRLVMFNLNGSPTRIIDGNAPGSFEFSRLGPVSIAVSNTQAFILSPFANQYKIYRFSSNLDGRTVLDTTPNLTPQASLRVDLEFIGTQLFLAFNRGVSEQQVFAFDPSATTIGTALNLGEQNFGAVNRVFGSARVDATTLAFLGTGGIRFSRGSTAATTTSFSNAIGAAFPPDSFAYVLGSSSLTRYDMTLLPVIDDAQGSVTLSAFRPQAIGWVLDLTP